MRRTQKEENNTKANIARITQTGGEGHGDKVPSKGRRRFERELVRSRLLAQVVVRVQAEQHPKIHHGVSVRPFCPADSLEKAGCKVHPQPKPLSQGIQSKRIRRGRAFVAPFQASERFRPTSTGLESINVRVAISSVKRPRAEIYQDLANSLSESISLSLFRINSPILVRLVATPTWNPNRNIYFFAVKAQR